MSGSFLKQEKVILVVDDDEHIRYALSDALSLEGYSIIEASSGNEALKVLHEQPVNLILSDIEMSDGDGFFLLKEIKNKTDMPPLIFISGHTEISTDLVKNLGAVVCCPSTGDTV